MSDQRVNAFVAQGTAAERVAFTPDPPAVLFGPDHGYFWFETDTGDLYAWNDAVSPGSWELVTTSGGGITQLTGDVTAGPGTGSQAATIPADTVTNAKLANMAAATVKMRAVGAGAGDPIDGTPDQLSTLLDAATDPFLRTSDTPTIDVTTLSGFPGGSPLTYLDSSGNFTEPAGSGAGGTAFEIQLSPLANEPPASNPATPDLRNSHPVLDFDGSTDEEAVFTSVLPNGYGGGGLTVDTFWAFTSATSGSLRVQAAIERIDVSSLDIDADSFASFNSAGGTAPSPSGQVIKVTITFTDGAQMDSLAAGELFRLKIRRDADGTSGTDDIPTDAELLYVTVRET